MGNSHAHQLYLRRAYVDDPRTFSRYAPIAEKILCLSEQIDSITDTQRNVLQQCALGVTGQNIEDSRIPYGTATAIISRYYLGALGRLSHFDKPLISRFLILRRLRMPKSSKKDWIRRYLDKPEVKLRHKIQYSQYYDANKKKINRQRRERWKEQSSNPKILKKRKRYNSKLEVLAKARERMRIFNIKHRKKLKVKSKQNCGTPSYRAWRKNFLLSKRYRAQVKVRQKIYKECAELLAQLKDSDDPWKRHDAALALGIRASEYKGASALLIKALSDSHRSVREALVWALGERREWKAARKLIGIANGADWAGDYEMLKNILTTLWKIGTPEALSVVKRYGVHHNPIIKSTATKLIEMPPFFISRDKKNKI